MADLGSDHVPVLVSYLLLHHTELGGGDVSAARPRQYGVQLFLLLLVWWLFGRHRLPVGWRGGCATPPPVIKVCIPIGPPLKAPVPVVMAIIVPIPEWGSQKDISKSKSKLLCETTTSRCKLCVTVRSVPCQNAGGPSLALWTWIDLFPWTSTYPIPVLWICLAPWTLICLALRIQICLVPWT